MLLYRIPENEIREIFTGVYPLNPDRNPCLDTFQKGPLILQSDWWKVCECKMTSLPGNENLARNVQY